MRVRHEEREHQPRRLVQGPSGARDDPRRRARGPPATRRHDRRAHERQHRSRAGNRRGSAGIHVRVRDDRQGRSREGVPPQGVRRRGDRLPCGCRAERSGQLLQRRRTTHERARRIPPQPVPEPPQPRGPREDHRAGDLASDRRPDHPLRRRRRHVRLDHGRRPIPQVDESRDPDHRGRPRGLRLLRRLRTSLSGRGRGRGLLSRRLGPRTARRHHRHQRRGEFPHRRATSPNERAS